MDAAGRLLSLRVLPGQRSDLDAAQDLIDNLPGRAGRVVADRGFSAAWFRQAIVAAGAEPCVPAQPTHPTVAYDRAAYARRSAVEQFWARMKEWRAIATRYDKRADTFRAGIALAASLDWLKE